MVRSFKAPCTTAELWEIREWSQPSVQLSAEVGLLVLGLDSGEEFLAPTVEREEEGDAIYSKKKEPAVLEWTTPAAKSILPSNSPTLESGDAYGEHIPIVRLQLSRV